MTIYVINRSTGEYSDRSETQLFYVTSEDQAVKAVETLDRQVQEFGHMSPERAEYPPHTTPEQVQETRAKQIKLNEIFAGRLTLFGVLDVDSFPMDRGETPYYWYVAVEELKL